MSTETAAKPTSKSASRQPAASTPPQATRTPRKAANPDIAAALASLAAAQKMTGARSAKISARVDPGILAAAATRLGLKPTDVSEVVNASLALGAAPDPFKAWWKDPGDPLPDDFELAI